MRHIVMFRFKEGFFGESVLEDAEMTFAKLREELPDDILAAEVHGNCVEREGNCDLAVMMELREKGSLDRYLKHPVHLELVRRWIPQIDVKVSFDYL